MKFSDNWANLKNRYTEWGNPDVEKQKVQKTLQSLNSMVMQAVLSNIRFQSELNFQMPIVFHKTESEFSLEQGERQNKMGGDRQENEHLLWV